ncbi:TIGR03086 family metal-binding protein [Nocardia neocaledoniensis]|uniref:TIGR03086 family metal-binding protein n=1 Tax=Nocardia neocaledoniensis TaxID=236511 RepID=UPI00245520FA|nr:TIGR03086 family metal-binding protein [Nocardia neocaledoniensis]
MSETERVATATAPLSKILRAITPDLLTAPTPCAEFDVRALLNHLLFWGPSLTGAARKRAVAPPAAAETDVDLTAGDWSAALDTHLDDLAAAWRDPAAWQGVTHMGSPTELPAPLVGGMVVGELIVHGWDLARAVDATVAWDEDLLRYAYAETAAPVEQGRAMGIYGPEVPVDPSAPLLDRLLGLTGRDPAWTSAG